MSNRCIVGSPINGISANGYTFLFDKNEGLLIFDNKEKAMGYISDQLGNRYSEMEINEMFTFLYYDAYREGDIMEVVNDNRLLDFAIFELNNTRAILESNGLKTHNALNAIQYIDMYRHKHTLVGGLNNEGTN